MDIAATDDYWPYLLLALAFGAGAVALIIWAFAKLKTEISLNKRVEAITGSAPNEEATAVLRRLDENSTEETILRLIPTLAGAKSALRQSGTPLNLVQYITAILFLASITAFAWDNPVIPKSVNFLEPFANVFLFHFPIFFGILKPIAQRRRRKILNQLSAAVSHMARSIQTGQPTDRAVVQAIEAAQEPLRSELSDIVKLSSIGIPIDESMRAVAPAIDLTEFDLLASALEAQAKSGGNLGDVLDAIVQVIRGRLQLRMKVDALTAEGKMSAYLMGILPCAILFYLSRANPSYVKPLFETTVGNWILGLGFVMIGLGLLIMLRLVRQKV